MAQEVIGSKDGQDFHVGEGNGLPDPSDPNYNNYNYNARTGKYSLPEGLATKTGGASATPAGLGLTYTPDPNLSAADAAAEAKARVSGYHDASGNVTPPPDENTIRKGVTDQFQTEIDALNTASAQARARIAQAFAPVAKNRVGESTAIQARHGLLGGDFGEAQTDTINKENADELQSKQAESDAKYQQLVDALYGQARTLAQTSYQNKLDAYGKGADATIEYLKGKSETAKKGAGTLAAQALAMGIDLSDKKNSDDVAALAKQIGTSSDVLVAAYAAAKQTAAEAEAKATVTVPAGGSVVDKATGQIKATTAPKPTVLAQGATLVDSSTGKTLAQGTPKTTNPGKYGTLQYDSASGKFVQVAKGTGGSTMSGTGGTTGTSVGPDPKISDPNKTDPAIGGLSHNTLDVLAKNYLNTQRMPSLGLGQAADVKLARFAILNRAGELAAGGDPAAQQALVKADADTLKTLTTQAGVTAKSEEVVGKQLDMLSGQLKKISDWHSPFANKIIRDFQNNFLGNDDTAPFVNTMMTTATEFAKATSGGTGSGQVYEGAREAAVKRLSEGITKGQFVTVSAAMRQEVQNVSSSYTDQIQAIKDRMAHYNSSNPGGSAPSANFNPDEARSKYNY